MRTNLFSSLSKYCATTDKRPLENFVTEAVAYLLQNDKNLLRKYLELLLNRSDLQINKPRIITQFGCEAGYIDLAIFWNEGRTMFSLFVEHKVWSSPWEYEDDQGTKDDQIRKYCLYQQKRVLNDGANHFVALISNAPVLGYSREDKADLLTYLGNYTWWNIKDLLLSRAGDRETDIARLEKEFVEFMKEEGMSGFDNFTLSELTAIPFYNSFYKNRRAIATKLWQFYTKDSLIKSPFEKHSLNYYQSPRRGKEDMKDYWGVLYHDNKNNLPEEAGFWIFTGICASVEDESFPATSYNAQMIPEVQCCVFRWFNTSQQVDDCWSQNKLYEWRKEENNEFEVTFRSGKVNYIGLQKRESLLHFLDKKNQEQEIWDFIQSGFKEITVGDNRVGQLALALLL